MGHHEYCSQRALRCFGLLHTGSFRDSEARAPPQGGRGLSSEPVRRNHWRAHRTHNPISSSLRAMRAFFSRLSACKPQHSKQFPHADLIGPDSRRSRQSSTRLSTSIGGIVTAGKNPGLTSLSAGRSRCAFRFARFQPILFDGRSSKRLGRNAGDASSRQHRCAAGSLLFNDTTSHHGQSER